jgi:hypothetical protein
MQAVAAARYCTVSDVAREAVVKDMQQRGLLDDKKEAVG